MRKKAIKLRKVLSLVLAFALLAGMLPMEWSTFVAKAADSYELVENAEVNDLLYFVDAGDYNTSTVPEGEKLGLLNSRTDQLYGEDATTGYSWGLQSLDGGEHDKPQPDGPQGQCKTYCQTSNNTSDITNRGYADWSNQTNVGQYDVSVRYGDKYDPYGKGIIRYDFEVPAGYYDVEVGFMAPFNNGYDAKVQVGGKTVATGRVDHMGTAVLKGTAKVKEEEPSIRVECSGDWDSGVQIAYIKVYKSEESRYYELGEGDILIEELNDGGYYMANQYFEVEIGTRGQIRALYLVGDEYRTNYVIDTDQAGIGHGVGELILSVKKEGEETYQEYFTTVSGDGRSFSIEDDKLVVTYENATGNKAINGFKVVETYQYVDDQLRWSATVENTGETDIVVGDWGIPIQFNENLSGTAEEIYQRRVVDHSFVGMDSSYLYATRPSGEGRYLLFTPEASTDAKLEYMDHWADQERANEESYVGGLFVYYIHSDNIKKTHRGYLDTNTSVTIPVGESKTYAFNFTAVMDEEDMRSTLYEEDLVDMVAVPGFAYSVDMPGKIYLHTKVPQEKIRIDIQCPHESGVYEDMGDNVYSVMEHTKTDENTYAKYLETKTVDGEQYHIYELKFTEFGHHNLIVNYEQAGGTKQAVSQFYMMDTVDNMLNDHAEFMVEKTQLDRPGKVGDKVFDEYWLNIKGNRIETFGEDGDGYFQMNYWGWGDDWGATHAQFLAEMNAISPNKDQVEALDAYLDVAIWNELMREHQKDYRVHNFLMEAPNTSPDGRGYAYPHIYNTYFSMYKIAENYPELVDYREDAETYLLRAYNIFCTQNNGSVGYGANCGTMGESSVPDIIEALEQEGYYEEAQNMLRIMEENKYEAFENRPYPYGSEYAYDNTAEEGVFVAAMLAQEYGFESDPYMSPEERIKALDDKTRACRGVQPLWYYYANPVTICNENWWNFQYSMALAAVPMDNWLRLQDNGMTQEEKGVAERVNYASKLGNLTCVNSGQICVDPETIGTVAWSYQSEMGDYAAVGDIRYNGWRHRAGESGLGLWGALRILSADVATDPIFGLFGYGCEVNDNGSAYEVTPLDGVQQRLHLIDEEIYIELNRDQYTKAVVNKDGTGFTLTVDSNGTGDKHDLELEVYGLAAGSYQIQAGDYTGTFTAAEGGTEKVVVPVTGNGSEITVTKTTVAGGLTVEIEEPAESAVSDTVKLYGKAVVGGAQIIEQRLHLIDEEIYIELNRDQYTKAVVNKDGTGFTLTVDSNGTGDKHDLELEVYGLAAGSYQIQAGDYTGTFTAAEGGTEKVVVPVTGNGSEITVTKTTVAGGLTVEIEEPAESAVSDTVKLYGKAVVGGAQIIDADKYEWTVQESGATIEDADKAVAKLNVTGAGAYHVTLKATVGSETKEKAVTITVKDDPAMKDEIARYTFELDTFDGKDENGENINNNAVIKSVGDTMGYTALASNFQKLEEGKDGKAARFTGDIKGGYIEFDSDVFSRLETATIMMDVCLKDTQANNAALMNLGNEIVVYFTSGNTLAMRIGEKETATELSLAADYWKNVALVANGDDYTLYLDGKACASLEDTGVILNQVGDSSRYLIGRNQGENESFYNGLMDNLVIKSKALSAKELAELVEEKEHTPVSVPETTLVTTVGTAPILPEQIRVLYTDGVYEMTDVEWEDIAPELYNKNGIFTVGGSAGGLDVEVQVLVVSGEQIQLEQLPDTKADSIMGDGNSTWLPVSSLITNPEPTTSSNLGGGAWQNWGHSSQNQQAWVSYTWEEPRIIIGSDAYFGIDGNQNFFPKSYELEYLDESGAWLPIENHSGYEVVMDGYSNVTFNPVVAKGIRLTMTPSKDGSAIIKWKVYGWPDADVSQVEIPVMGVELNKDEILFTEAGASETLTATVTPDNATNTNVTWSSDRPEVATVDQNGKVMAVASGTAAITVTTEDGKKTDSCVVTVEIPEPGHVHDDPLKKVDEKPATCTQEGSKAYYVCESCGTWFEDAAGEKAITDHDSVILPKTEHTPSDWKADADNHWKECTECTEAITGSLSAHSFEWIIDREATVTEAGSKHEECSVCGYAKDSVKIPATGTGSVDPEDPKDSQNPEQPDPGNPDQTASENSNGTAQTGDSSLIVVWMILLTLAGFCIAGMCIHKKRLG